MWETFKIKSQFPTVFPQVYTTKAVNVTAFVQLQTYSSSVVSCSSCIWRKWFKVL